MEIPVYALSQSFMDTLESEWQKEEIITIENYLSDIHIKYSGTAKNYCVRGETGIYIDEVIVYELNKEERGERDLTQWDFESSKLLYGGKKNDLGLFQKDSKGNKIPLTHLQATDPRIWNFLSVFILNKYVQKRWGESDNINRALLFSCSFENMSRHSITRLYWSANLCDDETKTDRLELLKILWTNQDFMGNIMEVNWSAKKQFLQWYLDFCKDPVNNNKLFKQKSIEGDWKYGKMKKLLVADNLVEPLGNMTQSEAFALFQTNLDAC